MVEGVVEVEEEEEEEVVVVLVGKTGSPVVALPKHSV